MSDRHQTKPYPLRMPDEMRQRLKKSADENHRSMNAEIVARLEYSLVDDDRLIEAGKESPPPEDAEGEALYLDISEEKLSEMFTKMNRDFLNKLKEEYGVKMKDKG